MKIVLTIVNAPNMHDCDCSGDGEFNACLSVIIGELVALDANELWNFISVAGSDDPEDTLLKIEVIVSVPFIVAFRGVYIYIYISIFRNDCFTFFFITVHTSK